jgi:hypothetical protein
MGSQFEPIAMAVVGANLDFPWPRDTAADIRNAQASLPVFDCLVANDDDLRINHRERLRRFIRLRLVLPVDGGDEDPEAFVDLRRCQANAVVLGHRVDHVVDEFLDRGALDL